MADLDALLAAFEDGTLHRPDPDQPHFLDLVSAVHGIAGVPETAPTAHTSMVAEQIGEPAHLVFVLVDGCCASRCPTSSSGTPGTRPTGNRPDGIAEQRDRGRRPRVRRSGATRRRWNGRWPRSWSSPAPKVCAPSTVTRHRPSPARRTRSRPSCVGWRPRAIAHVQLVIDPVTPAGVEALAPVLEALDAS